MRKPLVLLSACVLSLTAFGCSSSSSNNAGGDSGGPPPGDGGGGDGGNPADSTVGETGPGDSGRDVGPPVEGGPGISNIKTIFLILMENNNWSSIKGSSSAPYINSLLTMSPTSYCDNYFDNPKGVHPSEPNYIWLEAGDNLGITDDNSPSANLQTTTDHLVTYLAKAGVSWRAYEEDMTAGSCPLTSMGFYAPKHNPMVFFSDIVGMPPSTSAPGCVPTNEVPYTKLATDLSAGTAAQYNFITPNLCNDMHGAPGCPGTDNIATGDTWLSQQVPMIMASNAYKNGGAIFITWDESEGGEFPIGMIVLSSLAKGNGYVSHTKYYHSSMLRTAQEVFGALPLLRDAANQPNLSDLFTKYP